MKRRILVARVMVKCIECKHRWFVGPGEVPVGHVPICPKCGPVGVAVRAEART